MHETLREALQRKCLYRFRRLVQPTVINSRGVRVTIDYENWSREMVNVVLSDLYELPERKIVTRSIKPGDNILEIGGGIGVVGAEAALACGKTGRHVIFEANRLLIPAIKKNMRLNSVSAEVVFGVVVGNSHEGGEVEFHIDDNFWSSSLIEKKNGARRERVPAFRIDAVIKKYKPDIVIMDVEGAEKDLLVDMDLTNVRALCVEFHSRYIGRGVVNALIGRLLSSGFLIDFQLSNLETFAFLRASS